MIYGFRYGYRWKYKERWATALTNKLVAYYRAFNDATDSHINILDLTEVNSPSYDTGVIDRGFLLASASSQYCTRADHAAFSFTNKFSVSCWIRGRTGVGFANNEEALVTKWEHDTSTDWAVDRVSGSYRAYIAEANLGSGLFQSNPDSPSLFDMADETTWFHMAYVFDGTEATPADRGQFYHQGVAVATTSNVAMPASLNDGTGPFRIGAFSGTLTRYCNHMIDEIALFNDALTAGEVKYLRENPGPPA